jgi:hypothetical protein
MKYIFAILSIICLLGGITVMFDFGIFPWTDKTFFFLTVAGIFNSCIFGYLGTREEIVYSEHYKKIRKQQMNGMLTAIVLTGMLLFLIVFAL